MKLLLTFIFITLPCVDVVAQSKEAAIEDLKWIAVVSESEASFTFPRTKKEEWSWFNKETPNNLLEYSWNVTLGDNQSGYEFGPTLFKPGGTTPMSGSLSDLIETCQHDLWRVTDDSGDTIGEYGNTNVKDGKVCVKVIDGDLLEKLFGAKPKTVFMAINTPDFSLRTKVSVMYKK